MISERTSRQHHNKDDVSLTDRLIMGYYSIHAVHAVHVVIDSFPHLWVCTCLIISNSDMIKCNRQCCSRMCGRSVSDRVEQTAGAVWYTTVRAWNHRVISPPSPLVLCIQLSYTKLLFLFPPHKCAYICKTFGLEDHFYSYTNEDITTNSLLYWTKV